MERIPVRVGQKRRTMEGTSYTVTEVYEGGGCAVRFETESGFSEQFGWRQSSVEEDELMEDSFEDFIRDSSVDRQTRSIKPVTESGLKYDNDKPDYTLLPLADLEGVVRVLEYGAKKYARDNWRLVADGERRYLAAALRHLSQVLKQPGSVDPESGELHLDHALCSLIFLRGRING